MRKRKTTPTTHRLEQQKNTVYRRRKTAIAAANGHVILTIPTKGGWRIVGWNHAVVKARLAEWKRLEEAPASAAQQAAVTGRFARLGQAWLTWRQP
jgi:hypothetical protein